ncbi:heme-binding protein [Ottowia caeni]|uniref:GlcG/HbpS family heme-binding protein n=1 Tax=Ottowia caeni TaxID=2870339 RepID=UPI001E5382D3|nr:heme-binding protein [Ottowia caeni]
MDSLKLDQAQGIANAALETGRRKSLAPLAIAVLDARGCTQVLLAQEGTSLLRTDIATAKAAGALNMGVGGRELARRAEQNPGFVASLNAISQGRMVTVRGSVLVRDGQGRLLAAVGISGDTAENDEACAVAAIEAAGLHADTGD